MIGAHGDLRAPFSAEDEIEERDLFEKSHRFKNHREENGEGDVDGKDRRQRQHELDDSFAGINSLKMRSCAIQREQTRGREKYDCKNYHLRRCHRGYL